MIRACDRPGCSTLTLGPLCLAHEPPVTRTFARGRPFRPAHDLHDPVVGDSPNDASVAVHDGELLAGPVG